MVPEPEVDWALVMVAKPVARARRARFFMADMVSLRIRAFVLVRTDFEIVCQAEKVADPMVEWYMLLNERND